MRSVVRIHAARPGKTHDRRGEPRCLARELPAGPGARRPGRRRARGGEGRRIRARRGRGGAGGLGVSVVAEGVALRQAGIRAPVVVLGGLFPGEEPETVAYDLAAAVWNLEGARALAAAARAAGRTAAVHLKVNSGMTRLGC